jgi:hypothetical protein
MQDSAPYQHLLELSSKGRCMEVWTEYTDGVVCARVLSL